MLKNNKIVFDGSENYFRQNELKDNKIIELEKLNETILKHNKELIKENDYLKKFKEHMIADHPAEFKDKNKSSHKSLISVS